LPIYYDQYGQSYQTADVPFDYNQASEIDFGDGQVHAVGEIAAMANASIGIGSTGLYGALAPSPVNTVAGSLNTVIPGDPVGTAMAAVQHFAAAIYGDLEPGIIRHSSGYLDSDPTNGIRPGLVDLPRVVLPPWANVANRR